MKRHGASRRQLLPAMALLMAIFLLTPGCSRTAEPSTTLPGTSATVEHYTYEVVNAYPHDVDAFTEGLAFDNGTLYESTGLRGRSSLRKVELETGAVTDSIKLDRSLFGEGIAVVGNKIVQSHGSPAWASCTTRATFTFSVSSRMTLKGGASPATGSA